MYSQLVSFLIHTLVSVYQKIASMWIKVTWHYPNILLL